MAAVREMLQEIIVLKQELSLQAHLLSMDLKDQWITLVQRLDQLEEKLEDSLVNTAIKLGKAEERLFVGDEQEIQQLVDSLRNIKNKHHS